MVSRDFLLRWWGGVSGGTWGIPLGRCAAALRVWIIVMVPRRLGAFGCVLLAFHTWYLYYALLAPGHPEVQWTPLTSLRVVVSYVTVLLCYQFINLTLQAHRAWRIAANLVYLLTYVLAAAYAAKTKASVDYGVIALNIGEAYSWESVQVILAKLNIHMLLVGLALAAGLLLFEVKRGGSSRILHEPPLLPKLSACALAYLPFVVIPGASYDQITNLAISAISAERYTHLELTTMKRAAPPQGYPLIRESHRRPRQEIAAGSLPNVFIIVIESFNARFVNARSPEGQEFTPVFNRLAREGVFVERFYGNSIQTTKGQFATLFSLIPSLGGDNFEDYGDRRYYSLAEVLRDHGYDTVFFQGHEKLNFGHTGPFLERNGFSVVKSAYEFLDDADQPYVWGLGPEDHVLYRHLFQYLDVQQTTGHRPPYFVTVATISSHFPFQLPPARRAIYPTPHPMREHYANAIHLADGHLQAFFDELERRPYLSNSIVIITGDHSYPVGEHGIEDSEVGFYEESFRTPFLLLWKGKVPPRWIAERPYSQIDIAPTLCDLLGIEVPRHHFQGHSIMDGSVPPRPVYLVQPYNGHYVGIVRGRYHYVKRLLSGEELLFDLRADPGEDHNLVGDPGFLPELTELRKALDYAFLTQWLTRENRIWDGDKG